MDEKDLAYVLTVLIENPCERYAVEDKADVPDEWEEIEYLLRIADALWLYAQHPPPLEDDPVVKTLGISREP
ncbi:MAG: hypothetical protein H9W81_07700 [Enterococcus sp.]|nr:hypothetical protein [Enterococcus sp.]